MICLRFFSRVFLSGVGVMVPWSSSHLAAPVAWGGGKPAGPGWTPGIQRENFPTKFRGNTTFSTEKPRRFPATPTGTARPGAGGGGGGGLGNRVDFLTNDQLFLEIFADK